MSDPHPVLELAEWQTAELPGVALSESDRRLVAQIHAGQGRLTVDELRTSIRVRAYSWIGVVRFDTFEVRVVPKLAGDNLGLIEMIPFTDGLDVLRRNPGTRRIQTDQSDHLFDLLCLLFAEACERIVQTGLLQDYVEREDDLPVVRGPSIGGEAGTRVHYGRLDRLECRYDDRSGDIVENQILATTLNLCRRHVVHSRVRFRLHRLHALFSGLCTPLETDLASTLSSLSYNRLNEHYREAHLLARLLMEGMGIQDR